MRKPISIFTAVLALLALLALLVPQVAQAGTRTYPIGTTGVTLTMTTPDTYSRCTAGTDTVTVTGMPASGFRLLGDITVAFVLPNGGRQTVPNGLHHVDTTSNLSVQVSYPPIDQWPVQSSGTAEIHVDVSIEVYVSGNLVTTIGPGQQWDVFCLGRPTPTHTPTNTPVTPSSTPTSTSTNTPVAPSPTPTSTSTNTTVAPSATPTSTSTNTTVAPSPTPTSTSTSTTVAPSLTPTSTNGTPGPTPTNTPTSTTGAPRATPTSTNTPGSSAPQPTPVPPTPTPTTAVTPPGIPVSGEGPGLREIGVMLLAMLGVGLVAAAGAGLLAGRGRRAR